MFTWSVTNDIVQFTVVSFQMCVSLKKTYTLMFSECGLSVAIDSKL